MQGQILVNNRGLASKNRGAVGGNCVGETVTRDYLGKVVTPVETGVQGNLTIQPHWIPVFTGMSNMLQPVLIA
jgi:hypothetical protein